MKNIQNTIIASAVAVLLAACGGGGSSPSSAPAATTPTTPVATTPTVTPANLQLTVPAMTYAASSQEYAFVTALNDFRKQVGLGLLAQNDKLDLSAQNHLQYVLTNDINNGGTVDMTKTDPSTGLSMFHIEQAGKAGFTGVQPSDRSKAAGYPAGASEQLSFAGGKGGVVAFQALAGTVYHRAGLMFQGARDIGVAAGKDQSQTFVMEFASVTPQSNASDFVGVYPADQQTGVGLHATAEAPNPFPELSTSNTDVPTKTGYPVTVESKEGTTLEVVTFTLTETGASMPLDSRIITQVNDPNHALAANFAFLVANAALKPNTVYRVAFTGRVNNVLVTKAWSFTTQS